MLSRRGEAGEMSLGLEYISCKVDAVNRLGEGDGNWGDKMGLGDERL